MKKIGCGIICMVMFFLASSIAWTAPNAYVGTSSTPINHVQLTYDIKTQILHVEANHVSSRLEKNFVRKVVIIKNSKDIQEFRFVRQREPSKFIEDINYQAKPGDHLDVELWGSMGGKGQASLDILEPNMEDSNEEKTIPNGE